ncbi:hypothetical protein J8I29_14505 [Labrys sp. LIt4]|uniref:hypothetical protein n=1 Tax=Labrys sp. LIt4 TaxID=2821355 RepID=UPI001ADF7A0E|nr:hypothetical protein [Labrys sp. LIt4]MBP0580532.1 hypothetical protein [Labrys sp. LIt4]
MELEPVSVEGTIHTFVVPPRIKEVQITSRSGLVASEKGKRASRFGIAIGRIVVRTARMIREVPLDHPLLGRGFHPCERDGNRQWRWSKGVANVPLFPLTIDDLTPVQLEIHLHAKLSSYDV